MFLVILFSVIFMCSFHVKCWSNKTLRNLIDSSLCISWLLFISFGRQRGTSCFLPMLWLSFFTHLKIVSILVVNQSLIFFSSVLKTVIRCLMYLWLKERLVPSANITGSNKRDASHRSLTCTTNRSGSRKDPLGAPQVTYWISVLLFLPVSMYCFLLDK